MKSLLKKIIPAKIRQHPRTMHLRLWLNFIFIIRRRLISQLSIKEKHIDVELKNRKKRIFIPLIETRHYQHFQLLAIAKALELRGAEVKILICGQFLDGCEIKSYRNEEVKNPCYECKFNEKNILPLFNLDVIRLSEIITQTQKSELIKEAKMLMKSNSSSFSRHGITLDEHVDTSIIRYYYGGVPEDELLVNKVRFNHLVTAMISIEVAHKMDVEWSPDVVFNSMYNYSAWGPMFEYYKTNGNRFNSVSINNFNYNGLIVNTPELFQSTERYEKFLVWRNHKILNEKELHILREFIQSRIDGKARFFKDYNYSINPQSATSIKKRLNINQDKRNLFLFSNVFWDIGISSQSDLFEGVIDWILQTIEIVKHEEEKVHLYIKPHPGEKNNSLSSSTGISDIIYNRYPKLPDNITIIDTDWDISTYDLFPHIDMGVMFNGTLGLEMMLSNIPVVTTGKTTYQGLGFSFEPKTIEDYGQILLDRNSQESVNRNQIELYAYFYFIKTMIPWNLTKQAYDDQFDGFTIDSLNDLELGCDPYIDHLCNCILDPENTVVEGWVDVDDDFQARPPQNMAKEKV
jgi:hypothetical protein